MPQHGRRQTDQVLATALACGATVDAAAHKAGLSPATVYHRLKDPVFRQLLQQTLSDMVKRISGALTGLGLEAVRALAELLKSSTSAAVCLGAVRVAQENGMKFREVADFEQLLAALEQRQAESEAADYYGASA